MTQAITNKTKKLQDLISSDKFKEQIALALPKHLTPDRMARVALTTVLKTPKLAECDPASVLQALMTCSQHGIEPDGRRAYLIPYGKQCQLIIGYQGLVELILNAEDISNIYAKEVRANDEFDYNKGELITHRFDLGTDRGDIVGAYCLIRYKDGHEKCEVMDMSELQTVRNCSKAKESGPYQKFEAEMYKKIVIKRAAKMVKLNPNLRDAIESDDDQFKFNDKPQRAKATHSDMFTEDVVVKETEEVSP